MDTTTFYTRSVIYQQLKHFLQSEGIIICQFTQFTYSWKYQIVIKQTATKENKVFANGWQADNFV